MRLFKRRSWKLFFKNQLNEWSKKKEYKFEDTRKLYQKLLFENNSNIKDEEDLKIHFTTEIKKFFDANELPLAWKFEHQLKSKKRLDALVNNRTIIEFKEPNYFSRQANINKTKKKIQKEYIDKKEEAERINAIFYYGYKLAFYENKEFIGIFAISENIIKKLIYLLLNDEKKVFNSENLINDFSKLNGNLITFMLSFRSKLTSLEIKLRKNLYIVTKLL